MVERKTTLQFEERIPSQQGEVTLHGLIDGYRGKRIGSRTVVNGLKEIVKFAEETGDDKYGVLLSNAHAIQGEAQRNTDPHLAREMSTLIDFTTAVTTIDRPSSENHTELPELVTKYGIGEVGSGTVKRKLIDIMALNTRNGEDNHGVVDDARRVAQDKGDVPFVKECDVLRQFAPLLVPSERANATEIPQRKVA